MGRRIFENLKKAMAYIFAIHVPIAGMSLIPVFFKWPLALLPVHIVFLELIIDPACSVVFEAEAEESDVMRRPPRDPRERLFGRQTLSYSLFQGLGVLVAVVTFYAAALLLGYGDDEARALSFSTLIVANLGLIFVNRSWTETAAKRLRTPNKALWWVTGGAAAFLACALYIPALRRVFHFSYLTPSDVFFCMLFGAASVIWFELRKLGGKKKGIRNQESGVRENGSHF
jgi:Ca2+-transporting ATPase